MSNVSKMPFDVFTSMNCWNRSNNRLWGFFSVRPQAEPRKIQSSCMRLAKGPERHFSLAHFHTAIRIQQRRFCSVVLILMVMKYGCKRGRRLLFSPPCCDSACLSVFEEKAYTPQPPLACLRSANAPRDSCGLWPPLQAELSEQEVK